MTRKGCYLLGGFGVVAEFLTKIHPGVRVRLMLQSVGPSMLHTHIFIHLQKCLHQMCIVEQLEENGMVSDATGHWNPAEISPDR